jgi:hypothetical protein
MYYRKAAFWAISGHFRKVLERAKTPENTGIIGDVPYP